MPSKNNQGGFILLILMLVIAVASVVVYSFIRTKAREQGVDLPF